MFTFRLSILRFRVLAVRVAGRAFTATGSVAVTLGIQKIRRLHCRCCFIYMQCTRAVGTLVFRLLQAAQARDTRARFDCVGGASTLGEATGRRGRRGRAVALSPELAGLACCGCITHETRIGQGLLDLPLFGRNLQASYQSRR